MNCFTDPQQFSTGLRSSDSGGAYACLGMELMHILDDIHVTCKHDYSRSTSY